MTSPLKKTGCQPTDGPTDTPLLELRRSKNSGGGTGDIDGPIEAWGYVIQKL